MSKTRQEKMELQVERILDKDSPTAAELEFCRKFENDLASRGGRVHTSEFNAPQALKASDWEGVTFDDVPLVVDNEGSICNAGDSSAG